MCATIQHIMRAKIHELLGVNIDFIKSSRFNDAVVMLCVIFDLRCGCVVGIVLLDSGNHYGSPSYIYSTESSSSFVLLHSPY